MVMSVVRGEDADGRIVAESFLKYTLIRHPAVLVAPGTCYGRSDVALAPGWRSTIPGVVEAIGDMHHAMLWSSPARRCAVFAEALADGRPVHHDDRLLELDFGAWEGLAWEDVPRADLDVWAADPEAFAAPGGETGGALIARVQDFNAELRRRGGDVVVVSHGGPLRILSALLQGRPVDLLAASMGMGTVVQGEIKGL